MTRCFACERRAARQHLVEHDTQTPDVCAFIYLTTARLFRRHVTGSAHYQSRTGNDQYLRRCLQADTGSFALGELGQSKVEHFYVAIATDHDVLRLDVAMDNPGGVRGVESVGNL